MILKNFSSLSIIIILFFLIISGPDQILSQEELATTVTIITDPDTAEISIDGNVVGYSPVKGITITTGKHFLRAKKVGFKVWEDSLEISAGDNIIPIIQLKPDQKPGISIKKLLLWGTAGIAVTAIIGGVIYSIISQKEKSKSLAEPPAPPPGK